jgi:hypothetical protein
VAEARRNERLTSYACCKSWSLGHRHESSDHVILTTTNARASKPARNDISLDVQHNMPRPYQRRTKRNMVKPMSERKLQVLKLLADYPFDLKQPATGPVISSLLNWFVEDATPVLNRLAKDGYAEKSSMKARGAFIWMITKAGRDAYYEAIHEQSKAA